ncbi:MAG: hypothetical protein R2839_04315 [Thermomicrobiales bacterium]
MLGLSVPLMALMANTKEWSTAIVPIVINIVVLMLALSKDARQATKPA